jgi:hypothetical protein
MLVLAFLACRSVAVEHITQFEIGAPVAFVEQRRGDPRLAMAWGRTEEYDEDELKGAFDVFEGEDEVVVAGSYEAFAVACEACAQPAVRIMESGSYDVRTTSAVDLRPGAVFTADGGLVGMNAACGVSWVRDTGEATTVEVLGCLEGVFAANADGRAFVGTSEGIVVVEESGAPELLSDLVPRELAWNDDGHVYAVVDDTLSALEDASGAVAWTLPIDDELVAIAAFGVDGVMVLNDGDSGEIGLVDSAGLWLHVSFTPTFGEADLVVADAGDACAIRLRDAVHIFALNLDRP